MEIKGEEFIKKVQLQQEREELEQKLTELEEVETSIGVNNTIQNENNIEPNDQELGNIMLDSSSSNEENKKKYLILGLVLVILFLFTIIIIRLLTDSPKEDSFTAEKTQNSELIKTDEEDTNIEENFQKIMNERIKKDTKPVKTSEDKINNLEKMKNAIEEKAEIPEEAIDETIKKIEEKKKKVVAKAKPPVKKEVKKVVPKKTQVKKEPKRTVKDLVQKTSQSAPKGYFVQIGAFSKKPSSSYINKIRNAKLKYKVYQVEVKGKTYNKVLIGPYSSKATATENIESIKEKLNLSSAYILKF